MVMAHLLAAGELLDTDPELAQAHAMAARRRAARLPIVREAAAEAAHAAGDFATALTEYRAVARMTGNDAYLPIIADCERAVDKRDQALRTIAEGHRAHLDEVQQVELILVEAGLRDDMGQRAEGVRLLRNAIRDHLGPKESQARLRYAYGNLLADEGKKSEAVRWFEAAEALDIEGDLDADERLRELGVDVPERETDFDDADYLLIEEEKVEDNAATESTDDEMQPEPPDDGHEAENGPVDPVESAGDVLSDGAEHAVPDSTEHVVPDGTEHVVPDGTGDEPGPSSQASPEPQASTEPQAGPEQQGEPEPSHNNNEEDHS